MRTVVSAANSVVVSAIPVVRMPLPDGPFGPVENTANSEPVERWTEQVWTSSVYCGSTVAVARIRYVPACTTAECTVAYVSVITCLFGVYTVSVTCTEAGPAGPWAPIGPVAPSTMRSSVRVLQVCAGKILRIDPLFLLTQTTTLVSPTAFVIALNPIEPNTSPKATEMATRRLFEVFIFSEVTSLS